MANNNDCKKLNKIETIKNYIEVNPYGNTFLDDTIESFKCSLVETKKLFKPNCSFKFTSKEGRLYFDVNSISILNKSGETKSASVTMHNLNEERRYINGKTIKGGIIPIPEFVSIDLNLKTYCGSNNIEYSISKSIDDERIVVLKNLEKGHKFEFDTNDICGMSIEIENNFDFSLYLSGLPNMIKKKKLLNLPIDEMISILTYDFLNTIYSKYEITTIFDSNNSLNSYKYKTSLNHYSKVFNSDLFYKHDLLYSIESSLRNNIWSKEPISKELIMYQDVSLLSNSPIDLSIAVMNESIKFSNYIKEHLNFLLNLCNQ